MARKRVSVWIYWIIMSTFLLGACWGVVMKAQLELFVKAEITKPLDEPTHARTTLQGLWIAHEWAEEQKTNQEYALLVERLQAHHITDLYVHAGPFEQDGSINVLRYAASQNLTSYLSEHYPELKVYAWLGQVTTDWGGPLDLKDPETRTQMRDTVLEVLATGYDGVHINLEPIFSGDPYFLTFLEDLKPYLTATSSLLSLAIDDVAPVWGTELATSLLGVNVSLWSMDYVEHVARYADQMVVMTYDSGFKEPHHYSWYVSLMTQRLMSMRTPTQVLIGVPTYDVGDRMDPEVENLLTGMKGISDALKQKSETIPIGIAIYADWETSEEEWNSFQTYWLSDTP